MVIPINKAIKLLDENNALRIYISNNEKGETVATLSEKPVPNSKVLPSLIPPPTPIVPKAPSTDSGTLYMAPEAPPAPNADPVEYIKELAKRGAIFYSGAQKINPKEAIDLIEKNNKDVKIDVSKYPEVRLNGC